MTVDSILLRLEGVNLGAVLNDTDDLSTRRGAGLALIDAVDYVRKSLEERVKGIKPISIGASAGLFRVTPAASPDSWQKLAKSLEGTVATWLAPRNPPEGKTEEDLLRACLPHLTFVVDAIPSRGVHHFIEERERLIALNRWRQMRSVGLVPPGTAENGVSEVVCWFDGVRPAVHYPSVNNDSNGNKDPKPVSASVRARRDYGRRVKKTYLKELLSPSSELGDIEFTNDFNELVDGEPTRRLKGKMAVIYLDGNGFSSLKERYLHVRPRTVDPQQRLESFDGTLKQAREAAFGAVARVCLDVARRRGAGGAKVPLEVLLAGGDEMLLVVPARLGWEVLVAMFRSLEDRALCLGRYGDPFGEAPLTYAAGLVFCAHTAPIRDMTDLARQLADDVKERTGRRFNAFAYENLRSFDFPGDDFIEMRRRATPHGLDLADRILAPPAKADGEDEAERLRRAFDDLRTHLPQSRLQALMVDLWADDAAFEDRRNTLLDNLDPADQSKARSALATLGEYFAPPPTCRRPDPVALAKLTWSHLHALWDVCWPAWPSDGEDKG